MLIVCKTQEEDWEDVLRMGKDFAASNPHNLGFSEVAFRGVFDKAAEGDGLTFWVARAHGHAAGMMGGIVYPLFFNPEKKIAQELFFWVEPAQRKRDVRNALVAAFEAWGRRNGASMALLEAQENDRFPATNRLYRIIGYAPIGHLYSKEIAPWQ